jgi:hypothetical protein
MKSLVGEKELLETVRIKSRLLRDLRRRRLLPFVKLSSKMILYDPEKVLAALERFERTEAAK